MDNLTLLISKLNEQLEREIESKDILVAFSSNKVYIHYSDIDHFVHIKLKESIDEFMYKYYSGYNIYQGQYGEVLVKQGSELYSVVDLAVQLSIKQPNYSSIHIGVLCSSEVDNMKSNDIRISHHNIHTKFELLKSLLNAMKFEELKLFWKDNPSLQLKFNDTMYLQ